MHSSTAMPLFTPSGRPPLPGGDGLDYARKVVELEIVDAVSYETVRRTLKITE
jgi:hypothetical protein